MEIVSRLQSLFRVPLSAMPTALIFLAALLFFPALQPPSHAADQVVTNLNDLGPGSLRQAVIDVGALEEITFDVTGTIVLTSGEIEINKSIAITGPGARNLTIDGNGGQWIFHHLGGILSVSGLNLINISTACVESEDGSIDFAGCRFEGVNGQGLRFDSGADFFIVSEYLFTNCESGGTGGGLVSVDADGDITNSTFSGNRAGASGGGMSFINSGTIKISHCTITGNTTTWLGAGDGGGGIATTTFGPRVHLRNTIVADNTVSCCSNRPNIRSLAGTLFSQGYNLIGDDNGANWTGGLQATDTVDVADPALAPWPTTAAPPIPTPLNPAAWPWIPGSGRISTATR